jgi:uncharacterized surface protein with fasciclin (FAS1) repeats
MFRSKFMLAVALLSVLVLSFAAAFPVKAAPTTQNTIVDVALRINAETGEFTYLIAALQAAELVGALDGKGQFTVFAPTDAAFEALPAGTLEYLLKPENKQALANVLLYHVARGSRYSGDVVSSSQIRMMNKNFTYVSLMGNSAYINNAMILKVDVPASNGVIHVIDTVLVP